MPALRALLRRIRCGDSDQQTSTTRRLVLQHRRKSTRSHVQQRSVEPRLLRHVSTRFLRGALGGAGHVLQLQVLDHHYAVILGVAMAPGVQEVFALPAQLPVDLGHLGLLLLPVVGALLFLGKLALALGKGRGQGLAEARVGDEVPVGVREGDLDADVDGDGPPGGGRVLRLDLEGDVSKPLIDVADQLAGDGLSRHVSVQNDGKIPDLGEANQALLEVEPPDLGVELFEADGMDTSLLEGGHPALLGEEIAPGLVKTVEDDGYFSACFSYNKNTKPTPTGQKSKARVIVCDFRSPDDAFSQFIIQSWQKRSR